MIRYLELFAGPGI